MTKSRCLQEFHMVKAFAASAQAGHETPFCLIHAATKQAEDTNQVCLAGITVPGTDHSRAEKIFLESSSIS